MNYIEEHSDDFAPFMEEDEPFDVYVTRLRQEKEWGGHQELVAASRLYKVRAAMCTTGPWRIPDPLCVCGLDGVERVRFDGGRLVQCGVLPFPCRSINLVPPSVPHVCVLLHGA